MEQQLAHSVAEDNRRGHIDETARPYPRDVLATRITSGRRARAIENNIFALGHHGEHQIALADARTFQTQANQFQLLTIYEQRISRNVQRNLKQLQELQAERHHQRDRALEEAQLLAQQSLINGLAYDPAKDGFGFSNAEINFAIDRGNRLCEAKLAASFTRKPPAQPQPFAARAA